MANIEAKLRGVIFDYGNTLIWLGPERMSTRTDYADIVARPGAERLARFLAVEGLLVGSESRLVERYLEFREENRARAEKSGKEISARDSLIQTLAAMGAPTPSDEILRESIAESFIPEIEAIEPLLGAEEMLKALLARGVKIALLSNCTDGAYVATVIHRLGWDGIFDPFVVSSDIGVRKPLAGAFEPILKNWKFRPEEIVMVGDSLYHDVLGAERLGMLAVHFTAIENPGDPAVRSTIRPRWAVSTHSELQALLLSLID